MIYADNNSTTRVADQVLEAMRPFFAEHYGNPSSFHRLGQESRKALDQSREKIANFLHARHPSEIVFTSGGTESNNLAIRGALKSSSKRHLVTTRVEHVSVLSVFRELEREGYNVTWLNVDSDGRLNERDLTQALSGETALVSIQHANNETGVLFDVERIGRQVKEAGVLFHVDAVQAAGKTDIDLSRIPADFLTISGHKLHAPKGIGALFIRKGSPFTPVFHGGSQERDRRPGTENVAGAVGLGEACSIAGRNTGARQRMKELRSRLEEGLLETVRGARVNGGNSERLCNTSNISFEGADSEAILIALSEQGICASSGSACASGATQLSHVLVAMGLGESFAKGAVRFSLSRENTGTEIETVISSTARIIERLRKFQTAEV